MDIEIINTHFRSDDIPVLKINIVSIAEEHKYNSI